MPGAKARAALSHSKLALFGGDDGEGGDLLVDILALALGASDLVPVVFFEREDQFEGLLAIFTIVFIAGHGGLRREIWRDSKSGVRQGERGVKDSKRVAGGGGGSHNARRRFGRKDRGAEPRGWRQ